MKHTFCEANKYLFCNTEVISLIQLGPSSRGTDIIDNPELQIFREQEQLNPDQISNVHLNPAAHLDVLRKANSGTLFLIPP